MNEHIRKLILILEQGGADAALVSANVNLCYLTGGVFDGWLYVTADGTETRFVRSGEGVRVRKPEQIPELLASQPASVMLEDDYLSAREYARLAALFPGARLVPDELRRIRAVKTPDEIARIRASADAQKELYAAIPALFRPGMTDTELEAAVEYRARLLGDTRMFRLFGGKMELYGGSLLAGDNAGVAAPYDFAMGGAGVHPFNPIGACGRVIEPGMTVMVDYSLNKDGYLCDMTRTFGYQCTDERVSRCMDAASEILGTCAPMLRAGTPVREIYDRSLAIVEARGLSGQYMLAFNNTRFLGHGVGLEINEPPVITASKGTLEAGMVVALEPKFFVPGIGAAGIENTYVVGENGPENLTAFPDSLLELTD
ncbi:MAG: aminopeptidase P family protein [Eubacteriales bacterium]|nr:aminopeptidase P family protein [Eubacteriales bacterium]